MELREAVGAEESSSERPSSGDTGRPAPRGMFGRAGTELAPSGTELRPTPGVIDFTCKKIAGVHDLRLIVLTNLERRACLGRWWWGRSSGTLEASEAAVGDVGEGGQEVLRQGTAGVARRLERQMGI